MNKLHMMCIINIGILNALHINIGIAFDRDPPILVANNSFSALLYTLILLDNPSSFSYEQFYTVCSMTLLLYFLYFRFSYRTPLFQLLEYIILPLFPSIYLISLYLLKPLVYSANNASCQSMNVICPFYPLLRIVRMAILSYSLSSATMVVLGCIALGIFCFKFTYEHSFHEYILSVGVLVNLCSCVQFLLQEYFAVGYYNVGLIFGVVILLFTTGTKVVQAKYIHTATKGAVAEEDKLALCSAIEEIVFFKSAGIDWSQPSIYKIHLYFQSIVKSKSIVKAVETDESIKRDNIFKKKEKKSSSHKLMRSTKREAKSQSNGLMIQNREQEFETQMQFADEMSHDSFLHYIEKTFQQSQSFHCFEYYVFRCLHSAYLTKALVNYYKRLPNINRIQYFQQLVLHRIICAQMHSSLSFASKCQPHEQLLDSATAELEAICHHEILLLQLLLEQKRDIYALLSKRAELKDAFIRSMRKGVEENKHLNSSVYKCLYLLFNVHICRCKYSVGREIREIFFSTESKEMQRKCMLVVNKEGEVVQGNEVFKSTFKMGYALTPDNQIIALMPSEKQGRYHHTMYMSKKTKSEMDSHDKCYLAKTRSLNQKQVTVLELHKIRARIYHEEKQALRYICELESLEENTDLITMLQKDYEAVQENLAVEQPTYASLAQLNQTMHIVKFRLKNSEEVYFSEESNKLPRRKHAKDQDQTRQQKYKLIQEKLREEEYLKKQNIIQKNINFKLFIKILFVLIALGVGIGTRSLCNEKIMGLVDFITQEKREAKQTHLSSERQITLQIIKSINQSILSCNLTYPPFTRSTSNLLINNNKSPLTKDLFTSQYSTQFILSFYKPITSYSKQNSLLQSFFLQSQQASVDNSSQLDLPFYTPLSLINLLKQNSLTSSLFGRLSQAQVSYTNDNRSLILQIMLIQALVLGLALVAVLLLHSYSYSQIVNYCCSVQTLTVVQVRRRAVVIGNVLKSIALLRSHLLHSFDISKKLGITYQQKNAVLQTTIQQLYQEGKELLHERRSLKEQVQERKPVGKVQTKLSYNILKFMGWEIILLTLFFASILTLQMKNIFSHYYLLTQYQNISKAQTSLYQLLEDTNEAVAYNWIMLHNTNHSDPALKNATDTLINSTLQSLVKSTIKKDLTVYESTLSNTALYGNLCNLVPKAAKCLTFHNSLLLSGLSLVVPSLVQDQFRLFLEQPQAMGVLMDNICDKETLLIEYLMPIVNNVTFQGFKGLVELHDQTDYLLYVLMISMYIGIVIFFVINHLRVVTTEKKIRRETLMMDGLEELYKDDGFQEYLNKIYYQC